MIRIKIRKEIDRKKYLLFAILSFVIVLAAWLIASESGAIKEIFSPETTKCGELLYRVHQGWKPASEHRH